MMEPLPQSEHLHHLKKFPHAGFFNQSLPLLSTPGKHLVFFSNFIFSYCRMNYSIFNFMSFTYHNILEIHPNCCVYQ